MSMTARKTDTKLASTDFELNLIFPPCYDHSANSIVLSEV